MAIAETNPRRAKEAADRYRLSRSYTRYQDLLDQPDVDAVLVAVPNDQHLRVVIDSLAARKHVLLEPPLALQAKEAARMIEVARRSKRVFMVAQGLRLNRQTQMARRVIERGDLGEIYHARCFWVRRAGIPRIGSWYTQKRYSGGGCLADLGARILDACLFLMGDFEVRTVSAVAGARFGPRGLGESNWGRGEIDPKRTFDVEDFGAAFLRLSGGRTILLESAWAAQVGADSREQGIDLWGTKAALSLFPARLCRSGESGPRDGASEPAADVGGRGSGASFCAERPGGATTVGGPGRIAEAAADRGGLLCLGGRGQRDESGLSQG